MLGTYFTFVLLLFILLLTGGILAYSGDLKSTIKTPLLKWDPDQAFSFFWSTPLFIRTVAKYDDSATDGKAAAYKKAWNSIQKDVSAAISMLFTDSISIKLNFSSTVLLTLFRLLHVGNISFVYMMLSFVVAKVIAEAVALKIPNVMPNHHPDEMLWCGQRQRLANKCDCSKLGSKVSC